MPQHVVLDAKCPGSSKRGSPGTFAADSVTRVEYTLPIENLHAVLSRLWRAIPAGEGVIVANDLLELAMLHLHDPQRAVMQILHMATTITTTALLSVTRRSSTCSSLYSQTVYETLKRRLPARARDIHHLPYAIELPARVAHARTPGSLRLLFLGRLDRAKGVLDLPVIDALLVQRGVDVKWTIIGAGPADAELRTAWPRASSVEWLGQLSSREVLDRLPDFDVLILPTHAEGLPLVIVEAMAAGVVPVATDLPSIADLVTTGNTGQLVARGDVDGFAAAIERLHADRPCSNVGVRQHAQLWSIASTLLRASRTTARCLESGKPCGGPERSDCRCRMGAGWIDGGCRIPLFVPFVARCGVWPTCDAHHHAGRYRADDRVQSRGVYRRRDRKRAGANLGRFRARHCRRCLLGPDSRDRAAVCRA